MAPGGNLKGRGERVERRNDRPPPVAVVASVSQIVPERSVQLRVPAGVATDPRPASYCHCYTDAIRSRGLRLLVVPQLEAENVELDRVHALSLLGRGIHHALFGSDDGSARGRSGQHADEETDTVLVHV